MPTPEDEVREHIDVALETSGWKGQYTKTANPHVANGQEFADYLLYIDRKSNGASRPGKKASCSWEAKGSLLLGSTRSLAKSSGVCMSYL